MKSPRQKAHDLIELAMDEDGNEKERVSSAMKAVAIIHKYELLSSPLDDLLGSENETVKAASTVIDTLTNPDFLGAAKKIASRMGGSRGGSRRRRR